MNLFVAVEEASLAFGICNRGWITAALAAGGLVLAQLLPGPLQRTGLTGQPWWTLLHVGSQCAVILMLAGGALFARLRQGGSLHG